MKAGHEQEVYLSKDSNNVIKANNLAFLDEDDSGEHTTDFNLFINRLQSQIELFDNVPYKIIGFTNNSKGGASIVLEQPYIPKGKVYRLEYNFRMAQG